MEVNLSWGMLGLGGSVLAHAGATIWWASRVTSSLDSINSRLERMDKELEKRDSAQVRMWERIDDLRDLIHETRK